MSIRVNASFRYMEQLFTYKKTRSDDVFNFRRPGGTILPTGFVPSIALNSEFHRGNRSLFRYAVRQPAERNLDKLGRNKIPPKLHIHFA